MDAAGRTPACEHRPESERHRGRRLHQRTALPAPVPERKGISGIGRPCALWCGARGFVAFAPCRGLLAVVISGEHLWWGVPLAVVAFGVSGYAAYLGIFGVIRYGLFTEGCGAGEVAGELHLSKIAWISGVVAEIALLFTARCRGADREGSGLGAALRRTGAASRLPSGRRASPSRPSRVCGSRPRAHV